MMPMTYGVQVVFKEKIKVSGLLLVYGLFLSIGMAKVHLFDLDELYFAEISREMITTGNYGQVSFNFMPLYEKPPLFFWLQAASMHLWGINEIGARFPNLLCGLVTLVTLYHIGKKVKDKKFGLLWMCLHATAFLPYFYFKSGIIDPIFNYFLLLAIYHLSCLPRQNSWLHKEHHTISAGIYIGFALLTKGPMGAFIPLSTARLADGLLIKERIRWKALTYVIAIAALIGSSWLIPEITIHGTAFIKHFWDYHWMLFHQPVETHNHPWYYHSLILLAGCFPSSLLALASLRKEIDGTNMVFKHYMQTVGAIVLVTFTLVGTKIAHYSSMAYFPITFFATHWLYHYLASACNSKEWLSRWLPHLFAVIGTLIGSLLAILPWLIKEKEWLIAFLNNQIVTDALTDDSVIWNFWDSLPGLLYIIGSWIAWYALMRCNFPAFAGSFMSTNILTLTLLLYCIAPKIECYTQKGLVDFCKAHKKEDAYLITIGFKAAAPLFYMNRQPAQCLQEQHLPWLLDGKIDKPAFFIIYKKDKAFFASYPSVTLVQEDVCFAFYKRTPP